MTSLPTSRETTLVAPINRGCDRLIAMLRHSPRRLLVWILAIYGTLWLAATLSFPSMPFDSYEMFLFGREMQWGYWKHPPLEPWLTEIAYRATGGWIGSHFVLAIGSIVLTFWFVWLLGRQIVGETGAVLAVGLTLLGYYFTHPVTMYSHNVGQLPVWAATVYLYRNAVLGNRWRHWLWLGVASALLIYAKYSGALLIAVLAGHMLLTAEGRSRILTPGPWIAAAIGLGIWLPNLIWLVRNDFLPFTFAFDRPPAPGAGPRVFAALNFVVAQIGFHAGLIGLMVLAALRGLPWQGAPVSLDLKRPTAFDRSLVLSTALLPILIIAAMTFAAGVQQRSEIGGSLVALSGLALVVLLPQRPALHAPRVAAAIWAIALVGLPLGHIAFVHLKPRFGSPVPTQMLPVRELSAAMQQIWSRHTPAPLDIVTGQFMQAGFVALHASPRPSVFIDADVRKSPWVTPERLKRSGTLVLWTLKEFPATGELPPPYRAALAGLTPVFGAYELALGYNGRIETYGWAVLPPAR